MKNVVNRTLWVKKTNNTIISSVMRRYICAVVILLGMSVSAWGETITITYNYNSDYNDMWDGDMTDVSGGANPYWKITGTATFSIPIPIQPTSNITISIKMAYADSGTEGLEKISASGTETSSNWTLGETSACSHSGSDYSTCNFTITKNATPTTLEGLDITLNRKAGKNLRVQKIQVSYTSADVSTIVLTRSGLPVTSIDFGTITSAEIDEWTFDVSAFCVTTGYYDEYFIIAVTGDDVFYDSDYATTYGYLYNKTDQFKVGYAVDAPGTYNGTLTIYAYSTKECGAYYDGASVELEIPITITYTASCTTSPTVEEGSYSDVYSTTATISCSDGISSLGSAGCSISSYGFAVGTASNPTIGNTLTTGGATYEVGTSYTTTDVEFSKDLTGLSPNTTYYVRPYATNGNGTAYGTQTSFTTLQRYAITYYKNDGGATSDVEYKDHGVDYTISSNKFSRDHYTLSKWHTLAAGTGGTDYAKGASYTSNAALNLYAVWQINTHSLHWYKNADDADDLTGTYTDGNAIAYGATVTAPNTPTRTGYTFAGWSETSSGSTTTPVTSMPDADKSYYAIWTAHTYSVHFDANHDDAEGSMDDQDFTYGVAQALTSCGFTNEGYFFKGWATTNDGDVVYTNGQSVSNLSSTDEDVVDLFAVWGTYEKYVFACVDISVASAAAGKALITSRYEADKNINIMAANPIKVTVSGAVSGHRVTFTNSVGLHFYKKVEGTGDDAGKYKYIEATGANSFVTPLTNQEVYVSYKPTSVGTGAILSELPFTISCDAESQTFNSEGEYIKVRNLPSSVAIVANVGGSWHGLSANITSSSTPKDTMIAVATDEGILKAYGPSATFAYKLWPVRTVNSSYDRSGYTYSSGYPAKLYGDRLRFAGKDNKGLVANDNPTSNKYNINNYGAITAITADFEHDENYEWKVVTREVDGQFVYTLQTDQTNNNRYLRLYNGRWGTYLDEKGTEELYILPLVDTKLVEMRPYEWGTDQVVVYYTPEATPVVLTGVNMGSDAVASPTFAQIGTSDLWRVSGLTGLTSKPAQQLQIQITENGTGKQGLLQIPLIVSGTSTEAELRASLPGANATEKNKVAKNTDVIILSGGKMTTNTASGNFQDLYIYAGGKAIISNAMSFGSVYMRGGFGYIGDETWDVSRAKIDAAVTLAEGGALYYDLTVDASKYYDLAVPYEVDLTAATDDKGDGDFNVWLKVYDGAKRASNLKKGWDWYDWSGDLKLHPGTGYLIAASPRYNRSYCTIRFPMNPDLSSGEAAQDEIEVTAYGMTDGELDEGVTANNAGWNFIANPYMCNFGMSDIEESEDGVLKVGELVLDGDNKYQWDATGAKNIRYVTTFDYNSQEYSQVALSSAVLAPFTGFFVQVAIDGAVEFNTDGRQLSLPAYLRARQLPNDMEIVLSVEGNGQTDETRLHINDDLTLASALEFPEEMTKQINDGHLNFYTISNFTNMYANGMSYEDAQDWVPIGVIAPAEGTYTFHVGTVNASYIKSVLLKDFNSGNTYDLRQTNPQFILNPGTIEGRFAVKIVLQDEEDTPTAIDALGDSMNGSGPIKFIRHEKLFIMNNGVIYDATGKQVREINK